MHVRIEKRTGSVIVSGSLSSRKIRMKDEEFGRLSLTSIKEIDSVL